MAVCFQCLSPDSIMYYINADEETAVAPDSRIDDIATVIVYQMFEGKMYNCSRPDDLTV